MMTLTSTAMAPVWAVIAFLFGTIFGSFVCCLADRTVSGENVWRGRSHCDTCGHRLAPADLVPILSYFMLGGRCRYCGQKISLRSTLTEIVTGTAFVVIFLRFSLTFTTLKLFGLVCILGAVSLVDLQTFTIPDSFIAAGIIWWLVTVPLTIGFSVRAILLTVLGAAILGGGTWLVAIFFEKRAGQTGLGLGDVKLFFMTGLYVGLSNILLEVIASCVIGLFVAAASREHKIPFGPAISLATLFCVLAGGPIMMVYFGLI